MSRISRKLKDKIRKAADNRCAYCLSPQHLMLNVLEIDHIVPVATGGTDKVGWHPPKR
jgi:hypothetical protein